LRDAADGQLKQNNYINHASRKEKSFFLYVKISNFFYCESLFLI